MLGNLSRTLAIVLDNAGEVFWAVVD